MSDYGVTEKGFVIKRMDSIMEEIHSDLTTGFGFNTRLLRPSFLDVLVTTFSGQIAELWETAQDSYYAKYPATATGVNLDNAVQYGGIRRAANKRTCYPLHCTGDDGTVVPANSLVATDTKPEIRLYAANEFTITRDSFNSVTINVISAKINTAYTISINGESFTYVSNSKNLEDILLGIKESITNMEYVATISDTDNAVVIDDTVKTRKNVLSLSDNLTTVRVTAIANFFVNDYGKVTLPTGIVTKIVNNISGLDSVVNLLEPVYGRVEETDIELRQSYIAKSALRSNTMIDSIVSELLNNVSYIESASGYENDTDETNAYGLPPHSIEIVVEGGDNSEIASAILNRKAGGIQTYGSIEVDVPGLYGESIPIRFNRPQYLYTWVKATLYGKASELPSNYQALVSESIMDDCDTMAAGDDLLVQLLNDGIYNSVSGVTYIDIQTAYSTDKDYVPKSSEYSRKNVIASTRQKVLVKAERIEVSFIEDT
jgi:hypothetical protein